MKKWNILTISVLGIFLSNRLYTIDIANAAATAAKKLSTELQELIVENQLTYVVDFHWNPSESAPLTYTISRKEESACPDTEEGKDAFCKIIDGSQKARFLYEGDDYIAILKKTPRESRGALLIPTNHVRAIHQLSKEKIADLLDAGLQIISKENPDALKKGCNKIMQTRSGARQGVFHLHLHLELDTTQLFASIPATTRGNR